MLVVLGLLVSAEPLVRCFPLLHPSGCHCVVCVKLCCGWLLITRLQSYRWLSFLKAALVLLSWAALCSLNIIPPILHPHGEWEDFQFDNLLLSSFFGCLEILQIIHGTLELAESSLG